MKNKDGMKYLLAFIAIMAAKVSNKPIQNKKLRFF
jgi:hypothetical protein